jgi:hypothetical protein
MTAGVREPIETPSLLELGESWRRRLSVAAAVDCGRRGYALLGVKACRRVLAGQPAGSVRRGRAGRRRSRARSGPRRPDDGLDQGDAASALHRRIRHRPCCVGWSWSIASRRPAGRARHGVGTGPVILQHGNYFGWTGECRGQDHRPRPSRAGAVTDAVVTAAHSMSAIRFQPMGPSRLRVLPRRSACTQRAGPAVTPIRCELTSEGVSHGTGSWCRVVLRREADTHIVVGVCQGRPREISGTPSARGSGREHPWRTRQIPHLGLRRMQPGP